jgi:hypothetical protein
MQNRYVGDIGDYGKYGLLRVIATTDLRLGIVWYLNPCEEPNTDGRLTSYLFSRTKSWRDCDPVLHEALATIVKAGARHVRRIRELGILPPETLFFEDPLPVRPSRTGFDARSAWYSRALEATREADVVFFDPDNSIAGVSVKKNSPNASKYVVLDELEAYIRRDQSIIVYHHQNRQGPLSRQVTEKLRLLQTISRSHVAWALTYHRQQARAYLVFSSKRHVPRLKDKCQKFLQGPWGAQGHFKAVLISR